MTSFARSTAGTSSDSIANRAHAPNALSVYIDTCAAPRSTVRRSHRKTCSRPVTVKTRRTCGASLSDCELRSCSPPDRRARRCARMWRGNYSLSGARVFDHGQLRRWAGREDSVRLRRAGRHRDNLKPLDARPVSLRLRTRGDGWEGHSLRDRGAVRAQPDDFTLDLDPSPESVRLARHAVADWMNLVDADPLAESAALLVSDLATNAVVHVGEPYRMAARWRPPRFRVDMLDVVPHFRPDSIARGPASADMD